jgi:hypothetical protein
VARVGGLLNDSSELATNALRVLVALLERSVPVKEVKQTGMVGKLCAALQAETIEVQLHALNALTLIAFAHPQEITEPVI